MGWKHFSDRLQVRPVLTAGREATGRDRKAPRKAWLVLRTGNGWWGLAVPNLWLVPDGKPLLSGREGLCNPRILDVFPPRGFPWENRERLQLPVRGSPFGDAVGAAAALSVTAGREQPHPKHPGKTELGESQEQSESCRVTSTARSHLGGSPGPPRLAPAGGSDRRELAEHKAKAGAARGERQPRGSRSPRPSPRYTTPPPAGMISFPARAVI